jgi:hypothetical protein
VPDKRHQCREWSSQGASLEHRWHQRSKLAARMRPMMSSSEQPAASRGGPVVALARDWRSPACQPAVRRGGWADAGRCASGRGGAALVRRKPERTALSGHCCARGAIRLVPASGKPYCEAPVALGRQTRGPSQSHPQEWGAAQWHGHFSRARTRIRVLPKVGTNGVREPVRVTRFGSALGFRVFLNPPADAWNCWTNQRRRDCLSLVAVLAQVLRAAEDEVDSASCLPTSR